MSTKIYNGIKFKSKNLDEIINSLVELRHKVKPKVIDRLVNEISANNKNLYNLNLTDHTLFYRDLLEKLKKEWNLNIDDIGIGYRVFIYYYPKDCNYYGYYINYNYFPDQENPLFTNDIALDFHYQNQTDKPEDISDDAWKYRLNVWDYCLPGLGRLQERGLRFDIINDSFIDYLDIKFMFDEIKKRIKDKENIIDEEK
jgi:hypothetical protein